MTYDDYQQLRGMYADIDELCRIFEEAGSGAAAEEGLRRLVELFREQQREPGQIRSFVQNLGVFDEVVWRVLGQGAPGEDAEDETGAAAQ